MRRRVRVGLDASVDTVRAAAIRVLHVQPTTEAVLEGPLDDRAGAPAMLRLEVSSEGDGCTATIDVRSTLDVPYFGWLWRAALWLRAPGMLREAAGILRADLAGESVPPPRPPPRFLRAPVAFSSEQARQLAAIAAVAVLVNFGGALLTQNGDAVTRSFDESDQALGVALALARAGVLVALVATALADRWGRRRMLLACLVGVGAANAMAALAPSFEVFTGSQIICRAFVNAALVVAAVVAIEEAPDGARAFAFSMFALALGLGFGLSVLLLPLADLSGDGWRIAFAVSALTLVCLPSVARNLRESRRYERLAARRARRGRVFEVFDRRYGMRFLLLGAVAFLANVFNAPSSQLTNRYLTDTHDFSNAEVALFRGTTAGLPGFVGIVLAGRLAESRGRRPVTIVGLLVASAFQMVFFVGDGALLWLMPSVAIMAAACAGLAVGTLDGELFPTEVRGTSNGFLLVCGVAGSAFGLLLATNLEDLVGGLGPGIALCGIAPIVAAILVVPRLPETRARTLDDVSPSEV